MFRPNILVTKCRSTDNKLSPANVMELVNLGQVLDQYLEIIAPFYLASLLTHCEEICAALRVILLPLLMMHYAGIDL